MRELRFRAWVKSEECYMGKWIDTQYPVTFSAVNEVAEYYSDNDLVVEQYTGLKDKNGKEIYEGDIVSYRGNNYQIKWCKASFAYIASSNNQYYWLSPSKSTVFEVIGNTYENPEMVEGAK